MTSKALNKLILKTTEDMPNTKDEKNQQRNKQIQPLTSFLTWYRHINIIIKLDLNTILILNLKYNGLVTFIFCFCFT